MQPFILQRRLPTPCMFYDFIMSHDQRGLMSFVFLLSLFSRCECNHPSYCYQVEGGGGAYKYQLIILARWDQVTL